MHSYHEIAEAIMNPEVSVISFDIFDTALFRPFLRPIDLFEYLDFQVKMILNSPMFIFSEARIAAEKHAINFDKHPDINQIYDSLSELYGIPNDKAEKIKELEISYEKQMLTPNKHILNLFNIAKNSNKKIIFCSDMYLPSHILAQILIDRGFDGFSKVFVSCEEKKSKKQGDLYKFVLESLGISNSKIIHIGDNPLGDIKSASNLAIKSYQILKPRDIFLHREGINKILYPNIDRLEISKKIIFGIIANHIYNNVELNTPITSLFNKNREIFGYYALGPFILGLIIWMHNIVLHKEKENVIFCARDGLLPFKAFNIIKENCDNINYDASYLYISRVALMPYAISQPGGFSYLSLLAQESSLTVDEFIHNICLTDNEYESIKKLFPVSTLKCKIQDKKDTIVKILKDNYKNVLEIFSERIKSINKYYVQEIKKPEKSILFDIGRRGTLQCVLSTILSSPLDACYLFTNKFIDKNAFYSKVFTYLGSEEISINKYSYQNAIYESLLSSTDNMFIGINNNQPLFSQDKPDERSISYIKEIQSGALHFIKDITYILGKDIFNLNISNMFSSFLLECFWKSPRDCSLLDGIVFDNPLSFTGKKSLWQQYMQPNIAFQPANMPRIMFYTPLMFLVRGGSERMTYYLCKELDKEKFVLHVTSRGDGSTNINPVYPLPSSVTLATNCHRPSIFEKELKSFKPDVVVTLASGQYILDISKICSKHKIPLIISERSEPRSALHEYWGKYSTSDFIKAYNQSSFITVQFNEFINRMPEAINAPIMTLYNPVFIPEKRGDVTKKNIILHVGRFHIRHKRQDILLAAFSEICKHTDDWELHLYGNPVYDKENIINELISTYGLENKVVIKGEVADLSEAYSEAKIFVLPSLLEGFPNALAEALSYGLPSIGFENCPGVNCLIKHGYNGFLAHKDDHLDLARNILQLIFDEELREQMSTNAVDSIRKYNPKKVFSSFIENIRIIAAVHRNDFRIPRNPRYATKVITKRESGDILTTRERKLLKLYRNPRLFFSDMMKNLSKKFEK